MKNARLIVVIVLSIVLFACAKSSSTKPAETSEEQVMCTQDAMQCPDGSWVGRTGPTCAFVCPSAKN